MVHTPIQSQPATPRIHSRSTRSRGPRVVRAWLGAGPVLRIVGWLMGIGLPSLGGDDASRLTNHWAFQPLRRPEPPRVQSTDRVLGPIDRFVQARLEGVGLSVGRETDPERLLRRMAFLVTGLPPSPEEIATYRTEAPEGREERWMARFLGSSRYGEAWGKRWLDAAGYADSNGYFNADTDRPLAFRYRDYVVRSFNRNKPFDQFVREQIAGDEMTDWRPGEAATPEIIELLEATHFLRNGQDGTGESDGNPDEVRADRYYALESALQIVGSCLLGTTLQCAKCHDHKFEPVTQRDYYALQALLYPAFNIEQWAKPNDRVVEAPLPGEREAWQERERSIDAALDRARAEFAAWSQAERPPGRVVFEDDFEGPEPFAERWSNTAPGDDRPGGTPPAQVDGGQSPAARRREGALAILDGGSAGDRWISTRQAFDWRPPATGDWIQVTFDLRSLQPEPSGRPAERVGYFLATHDFDDSSPEEGGNVLIDGNPNGPTQVHVDYPGQDAKSRGELGGHGYRAGHAYGVRVTRLSDREVSLEHWVDGVPDGKTLTLGVQDLARGGFGFEFCCGRSFVVDNVRIEVSQRTDPEWARREEVYRAALAERRKAHDDRVRALNAGRSPRPGRIAWVTDRSSDPPEVRLLKRGSPKTPGDVVEPGFPVFLGASTGATSSGGSTAPGSGRGTGRRLALARWLTEPGSRAAAMLARVTVNRVWQGYFGVGLVATPDNLGWSGARPTHPELLEWLASEFVDSGWDLKALHREILRSAVFRQTSVASAEALARDPGNEKLSRFPLRRLEAEPIRDAVLAVAGRLGPKSEGPYVATTRDGNGEVVVDEERPEAFSRSLFLQQRRTQVSSWLGLFDAPAMVFNCTRRPTTTQPLQALGLLNSDFAVRRGEDLARRLQQECGSDTEARIERGFLLAIGRSPTPTERGLMRGFLAQQASAYAGSAQAEEKLWGDFGQALFALNAFLYLE